MYIWVPIGGPKAPANQKIRPVAVSAPAEIVFEGYWAISGLQRLKIAMEGMRSSDVGHDVFERIVSSRQLVSS